MKHKKTILYLSLLLGMNLSAQNQDRVSEKSANHTTEAAIANASSFLQLIPEGQEKDYGFESRTDFSKVKIEEPFQTFYMNYKQNQLGFVEGNEWRVPLSINGKYVALLTVVVSEGHAEAVDFGASTLAKKLQELEVQLGIQHILIRSTYLSRDYVTSDFAALCGAPDASDFTALDMDSAQSLYELNSGPATPISASTFYTSTAAAVNNMAK